MTQESPVSPKAAIHDTEVRMITIGVDAHKRVHVAVALDAAGRQLGVWKGANSSRAWQELKDWAAAFGGQRVWGVEGAWSYGRGLAQHLVVSGEVVCEVNSRWTALGRRSARKRGKTDRLDARSVAAFVRQEAATLPRVGEDDETAVLDLLVRERENAMAEVTRLRNQIHALLMQIDSEYEIRLRNRRVRTRMRLLESYEPPVAASTPLQRERVAGVRRLATRARVAFEHAEGLAKRIRVLAQEGFAPLTELVGVDLLTAGQLAGILGPGHRFEGESQLAAYAGAAPFEASSAGLVRHRLNRGGHRQLNWILYRIVLTQSQHSEQARAYLARRRQEGKTTREAFRALKRYIVRAIWRLWQLCPGAVRREVVASAAA
ncbi:MAG: IS110 family transposase [Candidatus Dormiibacterota bacterium]